MPITEKSCSRCKKVKPIREFYANNETKLGYSSACKECVREAHKGYRKYNTYQCQSCGNDFKRRSDNKDSNNKYCKSCSPKIYGALSKGRILEKTRKGKNVTCDNCGKEHYKRLSQLKKGATHHFCSNDCQGEWSAKHYVSNGFIKGTDNSGENNGRYKHGKRIGGHDRHKKLKEALATRDGSGCIICETSERIHVHRIIPGALGGKYTLENTVMLCNVHHAAVHRDYELWKEKLLNMIDNTTQHRI
jgi:hypothetical protein